MKTSRIVLSIISALCIASGIESVEAQNCPPGHCSAQGAAVTSTCDELARITGKPKGQLEAPFVGNGVSCKCPCSCFAAETLIDSSKENFAVTEIESGRELLTRLGNRDIRYVMMSEVKDEPAIEVSLSTGKKLTVSSNHAFPTASGVLKSAQELTTADELLDASSNPVKIAAVATKPYTGRMYNFTIASTDANREDHLVVAEGVQSGDWSVQTTRDRLNKQVQLREILSLIKE